MYVGTSWKVSLKEMRCPSFSVSTRTPSQSKRRAEGSDEEEEEEAEAEQHNLRLLETPNVVVDMLRASSFEDSGVVVVVVRICVLS